MSTQFAAPIARFDYRVRIAAALLRSAPRCERLVVVGMVLTAAAAAWPLGGPPVAVPALLALAALIRHHLDGLEGRRDALTAVGANSSDTRVISSAGPLGATGLGALAGIVASIAVGRPATHALVPLAVGVAALLIPRGRLGAPALAAGSLAALVIGVLRVDASPVVRPRTRLGIAAPSAPSVATVPTAHAAASAWSAAWPQLLAAVLVVAAAQAASTHRDALRRFGRRLAAAARRRLITRSGT